MNILSNQTITLINSNNNVYLITCTSLNSKPDVYLSLFDSNTRLNLANQFNNQTSTGYCDAYNLCTKVLQVNFQFTDPRFSNISSITCQANSNDLAVNLTTSIQRNVTVINLTTTTTATTPMSTTSNKNLNFIFVILIFNFIYILASILPTLTTTKGQGILF
jgi:hypothetical protein